MIESKAWPKARSYRLWAATTAAAQPVMAARLLPLQIRLGYYFKMKSGRFKTWKEIIWTVMDILLKTTLAVFQLINYACNAALNENWTVRCRCNYLKASNWRDMSAQIYICILKNLFSNCARFHIVFNHSWHQIAAKHVNFRVSYCPALTGISGTTLGTRVLHKRTSKPTTWLLQSFSVTWLTTNVSC